MSGEGKTCAELAAATGLSESTVRRRMAKLERAGLVSRAGGRGRWRRGPVLYPPDAPAGPAEPPQAAAAQEIPAGQNDAPTGAAGKPPARHQGEAQDAVLLAVIDLHHQCESGTVTAEEVAAVTGLHLRAAQRHLAALAEGGQVTKVRRRGRGAGWTLPPRPQDRVKDKVAALLAEAEAA